ncbi:NAD(P)H-dependent glycerol-3-phosphate dehydrogenase [Ketobacter alkanivorans]|uniref:Glycerol-3-phosphate dehydrogenase [NAD(P)+] n=1 Tax=Ketobacter alkanivorans TaxID=1917421 RepID=A0A2K9LGE9_9GAMM|nr:NAD(P)H-dependent glycerol-3-phosphate dehydrogenase [Ketobacter alkanivorans]AUM11241.1 glycerol-3-phosphate dehydrogenase [Ketobacter alkanivorans]
MNSDAKKVAVLGGGSFGTSIANILADNGHQVRLWMRNQDTVHDIATIHENTRYLPGKKLNPSIIPTTCLETAVVSADLLFVAIPSKAFQSVVRDAAQWLNEDQILVSTTKGIGEDGFKLMSQILEENTPCKYIGVLSGPNLAKEVAERTLTGSVIASEHEEVRLAVQQTLSCGYFRVYANSDRFGVELGGALKNIYAIASGMAAALGMGENTKSMLITRSLAEMSRFAARLGGNPMTFLGLAGVGDLFVTCTSPLSRNYQVGYALAQGRQLEDILATLGGTAEGVNTIRLVKKQSEELEVYMPLVHGLYDILFEGKELKDVIKKLMLGEQNSDVEFVLPGPDKLANLKRG